MNILLLGKDGQVGTELKRSLLPLGHVFAVGRRELNLENLAALDQLLKEYRPHLIVNAAAYTAVDKAETDEEAAFHINETVVYRLAEYAKLNHALVIHYSTDYVFDGEQDTPYKETDSVNPQNVYGRSKWAGEQALKDSGCPFLIFRTSWVFSATGHNFIKTILRLAKEKETLNIVADQHGAPTSAELIADVTTLSVIGHRNGHLENGTYHLTAAGVTNWRDLACYCVEKALAHGAELMLKPDSIYPIGTSDYPVPAKRPKNSRLDTSALSHALRLHLPEWNIYVDRMITQLH